MNIYNSKNDFHPNIDINYHKEKEALEDSDILSLNPLTVRNLNFLNYEIYVD